jgi:hypothetical protein
MSSMINFGAVKLRQLTLHSAMPFKIRLGHWPTSPASLGRRGGVGIPTGSSDLGCPLRKAEGFAKVLHEPIMRRELDQTILDQRINRSGFGQAD